MTPTERHKAVKYLNDKRSSLIKRGADPANINQYFGNNGAFIKFSSLSDSQLSRITNRVKNEPRVTVVEGSIYPVNYVKNREYLVSQEGYQPMVRDYQRARESLLSNMTKKEYIKYRQEINKQTKNKWKEEILNAYGRINEKQERFNKNRNNKRVKEILRFIDKLNAKDFSNFLDAVDIRLGFSNVKYAIIQQGLIRDVDDDIETFDMLSHELDVLYSLYRDFIT